MSNQRNKTDNYPTLSRPFGSMRPEYDVVIVGSGYGAGVAASRMARAGKSVAVLELGWERRSGSFPEKFSHCLKDMSISGSSVNNSFVSKWLSSGDPTRLFQLFLGDGQHSFAAHGLGGTSLINAGVFLKADERTLEISSWPPEIRNHPSELEKYYSRAETMLQPVIYPDNSNLTKLGQLREDSKWIGAKDHFYQVPLTIFFRNGNNNAGVPMKRNRSSGHECTGLNDGSKNSVATTYLADAWHWGAEIFCGCEVRFVENMDDGGYIVHFAWHGSGRSVFVDHFKEQLFWVKAKEFCFLGAGALGTTEILLRSKKRGLQMSPLVGRNLSGNGDLLIFGYNGSSNINGIARQSSHLSTPPGPTVTAIIDNRVVDPLKNVLSGYVIQDGCIPETFNPVIQAMLTLQTMTSQALSFIWNPRQETGRTVAALKSLLLGPYAPSGSLQRTSTYLVMSHDSNEITLTLRGDKLCLRGPAEGQSEHFRGIRRIFKDLFTRTGARMGFSYFYGRYNEEVTVHLLGGANMSSDGTGYGGVTNHSGEVFRGSGNEVNPGLVCCDASIIPTALGVNPLATISALAERSISLAAERSRLSIDFRTENKPLDINSKPMVSQDDHNYQATIQEIPKSIGWQFTETMDGHICIGPDIGDFALSESLGKGSSCTMRMFLTIEICRHEGEELKGSSGPQYQGICTGTVSCYALSRATLKIVNGTVEFFTPLQEHVESTAISYNLKLLSVEGAQYHLEGHKIIKSEIAFSIRQTWESTTTVNVIITREDGRKIGGGALHISLLDFQKQMRTFRTTQVLQLSLLLKLIGFLVFFIYHISLFFFRPFVSLRFSQSTIKHTIEHKDVPFTSHNIVASDEVQSLIAIHDPISPQCSEESESKPALPPILLLSGVTGTGAMHNMFCLPFMRCGPVKYFTQRGYRCYALTPRWGCDPAVAKNATIFDCRLDVAAAIAYIQAKEQQKPYVIAHCQGSVALCMGLLDGTIPSSQLLGLTVNSVFMNQVFGYWNSLKGRSTLLIQFYELLAGDYFPILSAGHVLFQQLLDIVLRFYPVGHPRDMCTSTACRRTSFAFGLLWNHDNLDMGLHENIHQFFAGTHTKLMKQVVCMGSKGICTDNDSRSLLTAENLQRLQGLPILFTTGTENQVFDPESTLKDYELLRRRFGERLYRRFLVEGYGHLDPIVGKHAAEDVYWRILAHLKWCVNEMDVSIAK